MIKAIVAALLGSNTVIGDGNVVSIGGCAYSTPSRVSNAKTTTVIVGKNCIRSRSSRTTAPPPSRSMARRCTSTRH